MTDAENSDYWILILSVILSNSVSVVAMFPWDSIKDLGMEIEPGTHIKCKECHVFVI